MKDVRRTQVSTDKTKLVNEEDNKQWPLHLCGELTLSLICTWQPPLISMCLI